MDGMIQGLSLFYKCMAESIYAVVSVCKNRDHYDYYVTFRFPSRAPSDGGLYRYDKAGSISL